MALVISTANTFRPFPKDLDNAIMGMIVEKKSEKEPEDVRVKFLALAGHCGPEFSMERSLAVQLHSMLGAYLATGERQESK